MTQITYEYEERAFLDEADFLRIKNKLDAESLKATIDNKISYFYVLPDKNISIATSPLKTVIKYKDGQLINGDNGFEEREFEINPENLTEALNFFTAMFNLEPEKSEQFRINYILPNSIEVALKYTQTWGFHLEVEKLYSINDDFNIETEKTQAKNEVDNVGMLLNIKYISDEEIKQFASDSKAVKLKGPYSADEFRQKYGQIFYCKIFDNC